MTTLIRGAAVAVASIALIMSAAPAEAKKPYRNQGRHIVHGHGAPAPHTTSEVDGEGSVILVPVHPCFQEPCPPAYATSERNPR